jgi:hypothetical protein
VEKRNLKQHILFMFLTKGTSWMTIMEHFCIHCHQSSNFVDFIKISNTTRFGECTHKVLEQKSFPKCALHCCYKVLRLQQIEVFTFLMVPPKYAFVPIPHLLCYYIFETTTNYCGNSWVCYSWPFHTPLHWNEQNFLLLLEKNLCDYA